MARVAVAVDPRAAFEMGRAIADGISATRPMDPSVQARASALAQAALLIAYYRWAVPPEGRDDEGRMRAFLTAGSERMTQLLGEMFPDQETVN